MTKQTELEKLKEERRVDTEWLEKYKRIVDGLYAIADIQFETTVDDEWVAMYGGLSYLKKAIQEDIDSRKEETK